MPRGAITDYIDVAQMCLYAFWIFFFCLIWYLRREDKREGYPLISDRGGRGQVRGFPPIPPRKTFLLPHGGTQTAPRDEKNPPIAAVPVAPGMGWPYEPTGNPMIDGVGPAAYAERADLPELTYEGETRMAPLRVAKDFFIEPTDPDPRGMTVFGADDVAAGVVRDVWVDRTEPQVRYFEVETQAERRVLLPSVFACKILAGRFQQIMVSAITAAQFADVPTLRNPDQMTLLEEDKIAAYYAGGYRYATAHRMDPVL